MRKKPVIIITLFIAILLLLGACTPTPEPEQLLYEKLSVHLSPDAIPEDSTDKFDSHTFNIYLKSEQELYLSFYAEGAAVAVYVVTPADEMLGYEPSSGNSGIEDEELGHLVLNRLFAAEEGHFRLTASEPGFYEIGVRSCSLAGEVDALVEYWIQ